MIRKLGLGKKIGLGLGAVLVLLGIVAYTAWEALDTAADGFAEYRAIARDTNLAGELQANMLQVQQNVQDFVASSDTAKLDAYRTHLETMHGLLKRSQASVTDTNRAELIDTMATDVATYEETFDRVVTLQQQRDEKVHTVLDRVGPELSEGVSKLIAFYYERSEISGAFSAAQAQEHLLQARLHVANFLQGGDAGAADRVEVEIDALLKRMIIVGASATRDDTKADVKQLREQMITYRDTFREVVGAINERNALIASTLNVLGPKVADEVQAIKLDIQGEQGALGPRLQAQNERSTLIILAVALVAFAFGVLLSFALTRSITRPFRAMFQGLKRFSTEELEDVKEDFMGLTERLRSGSDQVTASSAQIASGASEQASSLEETSSSLEELAAMTEQNAQHAGQANEMMKGVRTRVAAADESMDELTTSFADISRANEETSRIVQSINEISFQTNLLALNAAVEAARAGEAGRGFAVVAEEVRNLATRAAEAAQNTAELIEATVGKVKHGSQLVASTNKAFKEVTESAPRVSQLIGEIAEASTEQSRGIGQLNEGVSEMDKVVQANASATEQLSAQAEELNEMVQVMMRILEGNKGGHALLEAGPQEAQRIEHLAWEDAHASNEGQGERRTKGNGRGNEAAQGDRGKGSARSLKAVLQQQAPPQSELEGDENWQEHWN